MRELHHCWPIAISPVPWYFMLEGAHSTQYTRRHSQFAFHLQNYWNGLYILPVDYNGTHLYA
jgi:hypothetical protein